MNKKITLAFTVMACALFSNAQDKMYIMKNNSIQAEYDLSTGVDSLVYYDESKTLQDSLYVMKSGSISGRYDISTQLDSVIFYNPGTGIGDINNDGELNILILGTSTSIKSGSEEFNPTTIATQLQSILSQDASITATPFVEAEDIYKSKVVPTRIGQNQPANDATYFCHSLFQYYHWPEGMADRKNNLKGNLTKNWDYVVICADPYILSTLPGYYALGVDKIASTVYQGGAKPLLMMMWPKETTNLASINHFGEFTYRAADGASVPIEIVPAGGAWTALDVSKKDISATHPSPNGAYLAAASIYSQIFKVSAAQSDYTYDDSIAEMASLAVASTPTTSPFINDHTFLSPFSPCNISNSTITFNHNGSSTEDGILTGLQWVFNKSPKSISRVFGTTLPAIFNYGRANTYFEANKRYIIDGTKYQYSFGLPMGDDNTGGSGDISMRYGIDKRNSDNDNGVDIRVATYMIDNNELPYARAIAIRTLVVVLFDEGLITTAYGDPWHLSDRLNKSIAGYMKTMLTGDCGLGIEPTDKTSAAWKDWRAHQIGYETAWRLMYLKQAPTCTN